MAVLGISVGVRHNILGVGTLAPDTSSEKSYTTIAHVFRYIFAKSKLSQKPAHAMSMAFIKAVKNSFKIVHASFKEGTILTIVTLSRRLTYICRVDDR